MGYTAMSRRAPQHSGRPPRPLVRLFAQMTEAPLGAPFPADHRLESCAAEARPGMMPTTRRNRRVWCSPAQAPCVEETVFEASTLASHPLHILYSTQSATSLAKLRMNATRFKMSPSVSV